MAAAGMAAVAMFQQFFGREPMLKFAAFGAAALQPEIIGGLLDLGLGGFVGGGGFHVAAGLMA